jgi:hypothetical protein
MDEQKIEIDKHNSIPCELHSTVFGHCENGLYIVTHCGSDSEYFEVNREDAKSIIKIIVEHFSKHSLTSDESDAIARII